MGPHKLSQDETQLQPAQILLVGYQHTTRSRCSISLGNLITGRNISRRKPGTSRGLLKVSGNFRQVAGLQEGSVRLPKINYITPWISIAISTNCYCIFSMASKATFFLRQGEKRNVLKVCLYQTLITHAENFGDGLFRMEDQLRRFQLEVTRIFSDNFRHGMCHLLRRRIGWH